MDFDDLISEGQTLARNSFLLSALPTDSGVVGYWGGQRADLPDALPAPDRVGVGFVGRRHLFSLSERLTSQVGVHQGAISLFAWEHASGGLSYRVEASERRRFAELSCSGEALYSTPNKSFPPFAAVCLYGSERVGGWLRAQGLARDEYWRVPGELGERYEQEWQRRSAFYRSGVDVIVGGWSFLWPEDDFLMPAELRFVALTLRQAEPWYELWHAPKSLGWQVKARTS